DAPARKADACAPADLRCDHPDAKRRAQRPTAKPNHQQAVKLITAWLRVLVGPVQVTELRALNVTEQFRRKPFTKGGFYDDAHLEDLAGEALEVTRDASGVYITLNPLSPDLLVRRSNRFGELSHGEGASDADVL